MSISPGSSRESRDGGEDRSSKLSPLSSRSGGSLRDTVLSALNSSRLTGATSRIFAKKFVKKTEGDEERGLTELLEDEKISMADARRLMEQYMGEGKFHASRTRKLKRWEEIAEKEGEHLATKAERRDEMVDAAIAARLADTSAKGKEGREVERGPDGRPIGLCTWRFVGKDGTTFVCNNRKLRHPMSGDMLATCGFHATRCVQEHPALSPAIDPTSANEFGECYTHLVARTGMAPRRYRNLTLVPGVERIEKRSSAHVRRPRWLLQEEAWVVSKITGGASELSAEEMEDEEEKKMLSQLRDAERGLFDDLLLEYRRYKLSRNRPDPETLAAIVKVQAMFRMRTTRRVYFNIIRLLDVEKRHKAIVYLQRMYRAKREGIQARAENRAKAICVLVIQRNWRNTRFLKKVEERRIRTNMANTIKRWYRRRRLFRAFRMMRIRLRARIDGILLARARVTLTRLMLGWIARWKVRKVRLEGFRRQMAAGLIQHAWHNYLDFVASQIALEEARRLKKEHKAARVIQEHWARFQRKKLAKKTIANKIRQVVLVQAEVRGFLARKRVKGMAGVPGKVWKWLGAKHSKEIIVDRLCLTSAAEIAEREKRKRLDAEDAARAIAQAMEKRRKDAEEKERLRREAGVMTVEEERMVVGKLMEATFCRADGGDPARTGNVKPAAFHRVCSAFGIPRKDTNVLLSRFHILATDMVCWKDFVDAFIYAKLPTRISEVIREEALVRGRLTSAPDGTEAKDGISLSQIGGGGGGGGGGRQDAATRRDTVDASGKVPRTRAIVEMHGVRGEVVVVDEAAMDPGRPFASLTLSDLKAQALVMDAYLKLSSRASQKLHDEAVEDLGRERKGLASRADLRSRQHVHRLARDVLGSRHGSRGSGGVDDRWYVAALDGAAHPIPPTRDSITLPPRQRTHSKSRGRRRKRKSDGGGDDKRESDEEFDVLEAARFDAQRWRKVPKELASIRQAMQSIAAAENERGIPNPILPSPIAPIDRTTGRITYSASSSRHETRRFKPQYPGDLPDRARTAATTETLLRITRSGALKPISSVAKVYTNLLLRLGAPHAFNTPELLLVDDTAPFLAFVTENSAVLHLHWKSLVADIRHGTATLVPASHQKMVQRALDGPQYERADRFEDLLRSLGFHGRETLRRSIAVSEIYGDVEAAARLPHRPTLLPRPPRLHDSLERSQVSRGPPTAPAVLKRSIGLDEQVDRVMAKRDTGISRLLQAVRGGKKEIRFGGSNDGEYDDDGDGGGGEGGEGGVGERKWHGAVLSEPDGTVRRGAVAIDFPLPPSPPPGHESSEPRAATSDVVLFSAASALDHAERHLSTDSRLVRRAAGFAATGAMDRAAELRETLHDTSAAATAMRSTITTTTARALPPLAQTSPVLLSPHIRHDRDDTARSPDAFESDGSGVDEVLASGTRSDEELVDGGSGSGEDLSHRPILHPPPIDTRSKGSIAPHLLFHRVDDTSQFPKTALAWIGRAMPVPPNAPPKGVKLPGCPKHQWLYPSDTCKECATFRQLPLPQPPVTFFPSLRMARAPPNELNITLHTEPRGSIRSAALVRGADGGSIAVVAIFAACSDVNSVIWLIGKRVWFQHELAPLQQSYRSSIMRPGQVVLGRHWVHIQVTDTNVIGSALVVQSKDHEVWKKVSRKTGMPLSNVFYHSEIVSKRTEIHLIELALRSGTLGGRLAAKTG